MGSGELVLAGVCAFALSGLPGSCGDRRGPWASASLVLLGSLLLVLASVLVLLGQGGDPLHLGWPALGAFGRLEVDALSAVFLLPLALIAGAGAVYGVGYDPADRGLRIWYGLLAAGIGLVLCLRHGILFLLAWELMALAAFFCIVRGHREPEVRRAGWTYLVATHLGSVLLLAAIQLLGLRAGSFAWEACSGQAAGLDRAIFLLALAGFGCKCGLFPLHFWLPGAHASAPSQVSALLSAVMLKTGLYGILRISGLLPQPEAWWGLLVLGLGCASALYGAFSALAQNDYKRLLACSSIENVGVILMGVGLALLGRAWSSPALVGLGLGAALLHVLNHALFKGLLFLGAGSLLHATGTRRIEHLGGLLRRMPLAGGCILLGCAAAAGLPPLNAFASEWVLYHGLFAALGQHGGWAGALGLGCLALTGGLALAAFTRLAGIALLGEPRRPEAHQAHDPGLAMLIPMLLLAAGCVLASVRLPALVQAILPALAGWGGPAAVPALVGVPVGWLVICAALVALALLALWALLLRRLDGRRGGVGTWDCGYAAPTGRMQYTARSFAGILTCEASPAALAPRPDRRPARGLFPAPGRFAAEAGELLLDRVVRPASVWVAVRLQRLRLLQQGFLPIYMIYIFITVAALLVAALWQAPQR